MLRAPILGLAVLFLTVLAPIAAVNAATQTTTFNKSITENNLTITVSGTVAVDTTAQTITVSIKITVVNDTSGQTIFSKTIMFFHSFATTSNGAFIQLIFTPNIILAASCSSAGCSVSNNPDINHQGTVNIVDASALALSFGSSKGDANFNPAADLDGNGSVDIMDASILALDFGLPVF